MRPINRKYYSTQSRVFTYKQECFGILFLALFSFIAASLLSFSPRDPSWYFYSTSHSKIINWGGLFGAHVAAIFIHLFGEAALIIPLMLGLIAKILITHSSLRVDFSRLAALAGLLLFTSALLSLHHLSWCSALAGGITGEFFTHTMLSSLSPLGAGICLYSLTWLSLAWLFNIPLITLVRNTTGIVVVLCAGLWTGLLITARYTAHTVKLASAALSFLAGACAKTYRYTLARFKKDDAQANALTQDQEQVIHDEEEIIVAQPALQTTQAQASTRLHFYAPRSLDVLGSQITLLRNSVFRAHVSALEKMPQSTKAQKYSLPDLSMFMRMLSKSKAQPEVDSLARERAQKLEEKLRHFGIEGSISAIRPGPAITLFEYSPEIQTKISKIMALEYDLALALHARSIRIIAPIPGRSVVGFEISNEKRESVLLSDIVTSSHFKEHAQNLPLILGVDIVGEPIIESLTKMPHLLVAGSTGSGKSVGLNAMLSTLLCSHTPDELKLILIDPKRLEFAPYQDIPHLLFPIVADPRKAPSVLKWLVGEMERRYEIMAKASVRNLTDFQESQAKGKLKEFDALPYIVLMIDELADLMMVAGKEIEGNIARIAQMARAAGIHMIVATQRPSVDVITGLIKVNFPSRISFRVTSRIDSKTIIDTGGAEKLLGKGDMLYVNANAHEPMRVHGAYISDSEIEKLTNFLRSQGKPEYLEETLLVVHNSSQSDDEDGLFQEVYEFVKTLDEVSISSIQRKYRIGYNRSARLMEQLEQTGILAPAQGGKPRKVIH
jgi:S-DNA-T family DNA segregation ATPase FtsK/SpoIIIE